MWFNAAHRPTRLRVIMRYILSFTLLFVMGLPVFSGCSKESLNVAVSPQTGTDRQDPRSDGNMETKHTPVSQNTQKLAAGFNQFGFGLLQHSTGGPTDNVFISPLSIATALSLAATGAKGATRQQINDTLGEIGIQPAESDKSNQELLNSLKSTDPNVKVEIANSIWAQKNAHFKEEFLGRNRQFFNAEIQAVDFSVTSTEQTINNWVDTKTHHKIKEIVKNLNPATMMMLINAVYFKGQWKDPFDKNITLPEKFTGGDGKAVEVPMMNQSAKYQYQKGDHWQSVALPYGEGRTSLYIFLPDEDSNLKTLVSQLNGQNWDRWLSGFSQKTGSIRIPKLKLEYESDLVTLLTELGIKDAFNPGKADFSGMTDQVPLYIQKVKHKTYLEVDEEGTTAAGVTSIEMRAGSAMPAPPFNFVVNRPFLMVIRDSQTGAVLFIGSIQKVD